MTATSSLEKDVIFYVLGTDTAQQREAFMAKLVNKIHREKRRCDIRFASEDEMTRFDLSLWQYQPEAFIPHSVQQTVQAPIQLWADQIATPCQDVLLNVHPDFPQNFLLYNRTIEVLDQTEHFIQMGRERWKAYKKEGLEPTVHKIK
ncbi:MAG: DNA polymerase III subunit chi [Hydrogenovibrio crunogenus]|nr:DNA polymerase III subunit chi [Hydrogenovibrio crunogenus]